MAGQSDDRDQQHHPPAGQDLFRRGNSPDTLLPGRGGLQGQLRRQEGQVSGPERPDPSLRPRPTTADRLKIIKLISNIVEVCLKDFRRTSTIFDISLMAKSSLWTEDHYYCNLCN